MHNIEYMYGTRVFFVQWLLTTLVAPHMCHMVQRVTEACSWSKHV